jgi:hypothetical protein
MLRQARCAPAVVRTTLVLAAVLVLSACQSDPGSSTAPSASPSASASPSPSPTPTTKSPEDEAIEQAEQALRAYYPVLDRSLQDPDGFNLEDYKTVAISSALVDAQNRFNAIAAQDLTQVGDIKLSSIEASKADLTFKPNVSPPEIPTVEFQVCYDVSGLNMVDKDGTSIVPADRKPRGVDRVGVSNFEYPDGPWLVGFVEHLEDETC